MEGGGVQSGNSAMKTPTHLPTQTHTEMTQRKTVEGKTHKRSREITPGFLKHRTHTHTHTTQKTEGVEIQRSVFKVL